MKNPNRVKQIFIDLAKTMHKSVQSGEDLTPPPGPISGPLIVRGNLVLHGPLAHDYAQAIELAKKQLGQDGPWSEDALDSLFALHLTDLASSEGSWDIARQANLLYDDLTKEPSNHVRSVSIFGLAWDVESLKFGLLDIQRESVTADHDFGHFVRKDQSLNVHMARLTVSAIDEETAALRATAVARRHIAVLNAVCSKPYPSHVILSDRTTGGYDFGLSRLQGEDGSFRTLLESKRDRFPLAKFELDRNLSARAGDRVDQLLKSDSQLAKTIVAAFELAGKASYEPDAHTAFLLFAIALESAVLGRDTREELTYQLAIRVAHLIGKDIDGRLSVVEQVRSLYGLRSKIVHTGSRNITVEDVNEIRFICLSVLLALCKSAEISEFTENAQLEQWFQRKMLESVVN